ncbi:hypothetical protein FGO68_gene4209 [Halteria grandinella]|uniref:Uncharacterized protein n=1 Tax=Halteria grandinella TaxID=5974 RepID=A0A8J8NRH6_HALGN|nr:hypothetical protein FGO68_gene4209 [Halteria grandinella]
MVIHNKVLSLDPPWYGLVRNLCLSGYCIIGSRLEHKVAKLLASDFHRDGHPLMLRYCCLNAGSLWNYGHCLLGCSSCRLLRGLAHLVEEDLVEQILCEGFVISYAIVH